MTYGYDDLNCIASAVSSESPSPEISASFTIDAYGNCNGESGTMNPSFPASTSTNQDTTDFSYDSAGRLTYGSWGTRTNRGFTWNPEGKMLTYSEGGTLDDCYRYATASYYIYGAGDGAHPLAEYASAWQTNVIADGKIIATVDSGGNADYLALDALGTTKQTDSYAVAPE